jgi:hypothetical protein
MEKVMAKLGVALTCLGVLGAAALIVGGAFAINPWLGAFVLCVGAIFVGGTILDEVR